MKLTLHDPIYTKTYNRNIEICLRDIKELYLYPSNTFHEYFRISHCIESSHQKHFESCI